MHARPLASEVPKANQQRKVIDALLLVWDNLRRQGLTDQQISEILDPLVCTVRILD